MHEDRKQNYPEIQEYVTHDTPFPLHIILLANVNVMNVIARPSIVCL